MTVVQALPKSERSELAVELATEAGADAFVAWQAARCVARWDGARGRQGAAAVACGRAVGGAAVAAAHIPPVDGCCPTTALVGRVRDAVAAGATVLVLHESATEPLTGR